MSSTLPWDVLLPHLQGVRPQRPAQGCNRSVVAYCPSHQHPPHKPGRKPDLIMSETQDGRLLLHCYAGCTVTDITASVGKSPADLFPSCAPDHHLSPPVGSWMTSASLADQICRKAATLAESKPELEVAAELIGLVKEFRQRVRQAMRQPLGPRE